MEYVIVAMYSTCRGTSVIVAMHNTCRGTSVIVGDAQHLPWNKCHCCDVQHLPWNKCHCWRCTALAVEQVSLLRCKTLAVEQVSLLRCTTLAVEYVIFGDIQKRFVDGRPKQRRNFLLKTISEPMVEAHGVRLVGLVYRPQSWLALAIGAWAECWLHLHTCSNYRRSRPAVGPALAPIADTVPGCSSQSDRTVGFGLGPINPTTENVIRLSGQMDPHQPSSRFGKKNRFPRCGLKEMRNHPPAKAVMAL